MPKRYQVCEISNGNLKHYYRNAKNNIAWMSYHRASMLTIDEANEIIRYYAMMEPERKLFIQSEDDCHFRETNRYEVILPLREEAV